MIHAELDARAVWLVADLHLRPDRPEEVAAFARQLDALPAACDALVVLGDLVDAWAGPGGWEEPGFEELVAAFRRLEARGIPAWVLRGNRDVLLEPADLGPLGARLADSLRVTPEEPGAAAALLSHGDEYCLRDRPYQRLRRALRWRPLRAVLRGLPGSLRRALARRMRRVSAEAVARKPLDSMALVDEAVGEALAARGAERAVIGHLHREERRELAGGGRLEVLPAWGPGSPPRPLGTGI